VETDLQVVSAPRSQIRVSKVTPINFITPLKGLWVLAALAAPAVASAHTPLHGERFL
jgi:hypothetical protein